MHVLKELFLMLCFYVVSGVIGGIIVIATNREAKDDVKESLLLAMGIGSAMGMFVMMLAHWLAMA